MSALDRCVSHPTAPHPNGECSVCERLAERVGTTDRGDGWQSAQDRYERWLDRIGGSR